MGFNINAHDWNPRIEGDGALVSENRPSPSYSLSYFTPNISIKTTFYHKAISVLFKTGDPGELDITLVTIEPFKVYEALW